MNFQMIQAVIKCLERSTVERIEDNSNDGHGGMRNKKLINRRNNITQGWQLCSP